MRPYPSSFFILLSNIYCSPTISAAAHLENSLDGAAGMCYTEREETLQECEDQDDKDTFCVPRQDLPDVKKRL